MAAVGTWSGGLTPAMETLTEDSLCDSHDELAGDRASGSTLVMLRNIPNDYSRSMVQELLDSEGFSGKLDFLYVPFDFKTGACKGYALVNLVDASTVKQFRNKFEGFCSWNTPSEVTSGPPYQGLGDIIERYRNSPLMHSSVADEFKPVLFNGGRRVPFPPPTRCVRAPRVRSSTGRANYPQAHLDGIQAAASDPQVSFPPGTSPGAVQGVDAGKPLGSFAGHAGRARKKSPSGNSRRLFLEDGKSESIWQPALEPMSYVPDMETMLSWRDASFGMDMAVAQLMSMQQQLEQHAEEHKQHKQYKQQHKMRDVLLSLQQQRHNKVQTVLQHQQMQQLASQPQQQPLLEQPPSSQQHVEPLKQPPSSQLDELLQSSASSKTPPFRSPMPTAQRSPPAYPETPPLRPGVLLDQSRAKPDAVAVAEQLEDSGSKDSMESTKLWQASSSGSSHPVVISVGTVGHPHDCAGACKFVSKPRGCKAGVNCDRCHVCKWTRGIQKTLRVRVAPGAPYD